MGKAMELATVKSGVTADGAPADGLETATEPPPEFSFVLPAFNEVENLALLLPRLVAAGEACGGCFEILWVNDGSTDGTEEALEAMASTDRRVRPVHLSRNFGHMAALTAGMEAARATGALVCLDSDGQHPPELIPELVERWREGVDIVQTVRKATAGETAVKKFTSKLFYGMMRHLADFDMPEGAADFRLLDRQVVDALNGLPERSRFLRGLVQWVGFRLETFEYVAPGRLAGVTKYSMRRMALFALSGITSFSVQPLRVSFGLGLGVLALAGLYGTYTLAAYFAGWPLERGWTSLLLTTLFLGGVQLITLGVASEYLGRIYEECKSRPVYITRRPRGRRSPAAAAGAAG